MLTPEKIEAIKAQLVDLPQDEQQNKLREILKGLSQEEREQLMGKQECPFCLIAQGKIPAKKVYEDAQVLAVLDINPVAKGHALVFPKEHATLLTSVPDATVRQLFSVANKIASAVFEAVGADGTNILVSNGPAAGQTSPHVLVNVIPRLSSDAVKIDFPRKQAEEKELGDLAERIQKHLPKEKPKVVAIEKSTGPEQMQRRVP